MLLNYIHLILFLFQISLFHLYIFGICDRSSFRKRNRLFQKKQGLQATKFDYSVCFFYCYSNEIRLASSYVRTSNLVDNQKGKGSPIKGFGKGVWEYSGKLIFIIAEKKYIIQQRKYRLIDIYNYKHLKKVLLINIKGL